MSEWKEQYNPFNSWKLMANADRWKSLIDRHAQPPILVTIDPANDCNLACPYCNAKSMTGLGTRLDQQLNKPLAKFLAEWGVRAVCVAGGGEPTISPQIIPDLVDAGLRVGVVTNGTLIDRWIEILKLCEWVGVSVDAATSETFQAIKDSDKFETVIKNIDLLAPLHAGGGRGHGVFYKYLILPGNEHEIADAAKIAKSLGCRGFHARPAGLPGVNGALVNEQRSVALELSDNDFGVYVVTHKVGADLAASNDFNNCWGCMMTCLISPHKDGFSVDLCCDQRGDMRLRLAEGLTDPHQILDVWDSEKHWAIHDSINPEKCPRCTYGPHSKIYENCVAVDNMTWEFI